MTKKEQSDWTDLPRSVAAREYIPLSATPGTTLEGVYAGESEVETRYGIRTVVGIDLSAPYTDGDGSPREAGEAIAFFLSADLRALKELACGAHVRITSEGVRGTRRIYAIQVRR